MNDKNAKKIETAIYSVSKEIGELRKELENYRAVVMVNNNTRETSVNKKIKEIYSTEEVI